jgi:hypothetical protein
MTLPRLVIGEFLILLMALLLATTPPGALRLHRPVSELLILSGTILLQTIHPFSHRVIVILLCLLLLAMTRYSHRSPWWTALIAWNPLLLIASILAIHPPG